MRRRLFNIASAVSLLLCVATVGLIIFSYIRPGAGFCVLYHVEGDDYLFVHRARLEHSMYINYPWNPPAKWDSSGDVSLWTPALIFALMGFGFRFISKRMLLYDRPGFCPKCDYNLTGNTSGVCPECGTAIEFLTKKKPAGGWLKVG